MRHDSWPLGEAQEAYSAEVLARIGINPQWKATDAHRAVAPPLLASADRLRRAHRELLRFS
jgi:hypothetical protein